MSATQQKRLWNIVKNATIPTKTSPQVSWIEDHQRHLAKKENPITGVKKFIVGCIIEHANGDRYYDPVYKSSTSWGTLKDF
jgi:hypothetical protein